MEYDAEVYLALFGDGFNPDEITRFVGIEPTSTRLKSIPAPIETSWLYSTGKIECDHVDVYKMSSDLISRLRPFETAIMDAKLKFDLSAVLQVVLWFTIDDTKSMPAMGFEMDVISFLHTIGASIDIDTYIK